MVGLGGWVEKLVIGLNLAQWKLKLPVGTELFNMPLMDSHLPVSDI